MLFFGRLHPLLVHFPIAFLLLAFLFEMLSRTKRFESLKHSVVPVLWLGAGAAVASSLTGYWLSLEGGYETEALNNHKWAGITTAVISLLVLWVKHRSLKSSTRVYRKMLSATFIILSVVLVAAGHLGANLTHGEEFLVEYAPWNDQVDEFADLVPQVADIEHAVFYPEVIYPILARKCYSCHSSKRQKGDLRLDSEEFLRIGGKSGPLLTGVTTDSTMLCKRIMLPVDHEKHMPPSEREQLSSAEIALIQAWIADGASMNKEVLAMSNANEVKTFWAAFEAMQQRRSWFPQHTVSHAGVEALNFLRDKGLMVLPVAADSPYLMISALDPEKVDDELLQELKAVADQLLILKLDHTQVTDAGMTLLSTFRNLRSLHLNYTRVGDKGVKELQSVKELRYLNLVGTEVTDDAVPILAEMENLEELYLYQTNVSSAAVEALTTKRTSVRVDTGNYYLPPRVTDTLVYTRAK